MNNTIVNIEMITVCDKCLRASCWQGDFMCDDYMNAGIAEKPRKMLEKLNLEDSGYWDNEGNQHHEDPPLNDKSD